MKKIFATTVLLLIMLTSLYAQQVKKDSFTREQFIHSQTVKSDTLNQKALQLAKPDASSAELNEAIRLIMSGLHTYAKFRDTIGLRETFDHLALVYHLQKKYVQAKWFYIQSNTFARELKDTANIINSLISLSRVKTDIKDYDLAASDLKEALALAKTKPGIDEQLIVQNALVAFYSKTGNDHKADQATKRIAFLKDSVARTTAAVKAPETKPVVANKPKPVTIAKDNGNSIIITAVVIGILLLLGFIYFRRKNNV